MLKIKKKIFVKEHLPNRLMCPRCPFWAAVAPFPRKIAFVILRSLTAPLVSGYHGDNGDCSGPLWRQWRVTGSVYSWAFSYSSYVGLFSLILPTALSSAVWTGALIGLGKISAIVGQPKRQYVLCIMFCGNILGGCKICDSLAIPEIHEEKNLQNMWRIQYLKADQQ